MTMNLSGRIFCQNLFVSDFIEFRTPNDTAMMDQMFCGTDWEGIWAEIQTDKISGPVGKAVSNVYFHRLR